MDLSIGAVSPTAEGPSQSRSDSADAEVRTAYRRPTAGGPEGFVEPQLFALHEVMQSVARETDLRRTLAIIAEQAQSLTAAASAAVTLLDPTRTLLDFAAVAGAGASEILGQTVRAEDALAGRTALTGEIYLAHHPHSAQPLLASLPPEMIRDIGVQSAVVVPIYLRGKPAGALAAINRADGGSFTGTDVLRLQILANGAAVALVAGDLRSLAAQKQRERDILFQAAHTTSSSLNVQEVLGAVLATVSNTMEVGAAAVFLLNDERTRLYIAADQGLEGDDRDRQLSTEGSGLAATAIASGQPLLVMDSFDDDAIEDQPLPGMRSLLLAPIVSRSSAEGLIVVGSRQAGSYTRDDASLISAVASQAAVSLENAWLYEDATRRAQEATAIYELSQSVGATLQRERVLHFVADSVLSLLHVDKFALFLLNPRTRCLEIRIARNIRRETVESMRPRLGEGIAGWVADFETPTAVQDVAADHRNRSCPIDTEGVQSLVSVPLQSGDQVIGVLHAMSSRRRLFTVAEMELLYTIANQVGAAIANAQMYEEARQQAEEIRKGTRRVARALGSSLNPQETGQVIADLATEMAGADRCVLLAADLPGSLVVRAATNFRSAVNGLETSVSEETPAGWVARRGRSLAIVNLSEETRFALPFYVSKERVGGYLGVPLKLGKALLGVLEVYTKDPRRFTRDEARLLIALGTQASVALQNAALVKAASSRLEDLGAIGDLAELLCRRGLNEQSWPACLRLLADATHASACLVRLADGQEQIYSTDVGDDEGLMESLRSLDIPSTQAPMPDRPVIGDGHLIRASIRAPYAILLLCRKPGDPLFDQHNRNLISSAASILSLASV